MDGLREGREGVVEREVVRVAYDPPFLPRCSGRPVAKRDAAEQRKNFKKEIRKCCCYNIFPPPKRFNLKNPIAARVAVAVAVSFCSTLSRRPRHPRETRRRREPSFLPSLILHTKRFNPLRCCWFLFLFLFSARDSFSIFPSPIILR